MWSLSILIGGLLASFAGSASTLVGAQVGKASVYSSERASVFAPAVDVLLRGSQGASVTIGQPTNAEMREEVTRVLASSISAGQLATADRAYLAQIVAHRAGVAPVDAEKRVDVVYADAGRAIDQARKTVVLVGLVTTTALMFGLVATWYAAQRGGHHRDHNIPARLGLFRKAAA